MHRHARSGAGSFTVLRLKNEPAGRTRLRQALYVPALVTVRIYAGMKVEYEPS